MLLYQVALVSEISAVSASQLLRVCAALQKQVSRDFGPIWELQATVSAFTRLEDVPLGAWPVIVRDDINTPGAAGVHEDKDGQPFALVAYDSDWPLTASHECLEMLADPFGSRLIPGRSVKRGQDRVEYLVEVCDPCEDIANAYTVNGILLSDFYTPHYFDPVKSTGALQLHRRDNPPTRSAQGRLPQLARPGDRPLVAAPVLRRAQDLPRPRGTIRPQR